MRMRRLSWLLFVAAAACTSTGPHDSGSVAGAQAGAASATGTTAGAHAGAAAGLGGDGAGAGPSAGSGPDSAGMAGNGGVASANHPYAPAVGKTALLIGQSGRRAHLDYVLGTASVPAGGSVYAELYTGKFLSFEQAAFVAYLARYYAGSLVEVGLSWKDNRVNAGYCDLADAACVANGGAVAPELDIVAGKYDAALNAFGQTLQGYSGLKFLVRVDYEVSPGMHCAPADKDTCPAYGAAFRYLKALWAKAGVNNVELVFHPTRGWAKQMYPGPEATDWIAFSVFNHDLCLPTPEGSNGGCQAGAHLDQNLAADLAWAEQQGKPILIAESTVQNPSDESANGFDDYLSRLFEIVDQHPQLRGLTYINMKWSGGWIYGEDWTQGAFGNVDARLARFPQTRELFCQKLGGQRFVSLGAAVLGCDQAAAKPALALPPDFDAPAYERLLVLGNNRCARVLGGSAPEGSAVVHSDCSGLALSGQCRFRVSEQAGHAHVYSDLSWLCWSAEGDAVVQRPCSELGSQSFGVTELGLGTGVRDVAFTTSDGRCVGAAPDATADAKLEIRACDASKLQTFRL